MYDYVPKHAKRPEVNSLPPILRGVADLLTIVDDGPEQGS
jgi:hypothetical protein